MYRFLGKKEPLKIYKTQSKSLKKISAVASHLPKLLLTNQVQKTVDALDKNDFSVQKIIKLNSKDEINLAMSQISFIAHAYIWGDSKPRQVLPEVISKPWVDLSNYLGRPPILSYASYCLDNWYKINPKKPITLDNVALINNFLGGVDEDWFVTIHVCIEDAAGDAVSYTHLTLPTKRIV